ncbi:hypothetical protein [Streptomyces sp. NPDC021969]|uniref:hypothetical protein n=1 Tax=Streptomyces sp. NPDC021969 TaxID=3155250 RepID=UPI0033D72896
MTARAAATARTPPPEDRRRTDPRGHPSSTPRKGGPAVPTPARRRRAARLLLLGTGRLLSGCGLHPADSGSSGSADDGPLTLAREHRNADTAPLYRPADY